MRRFMLISALLSVSLSLGMFFGVRASDELSGNLLFVRAENKGYVFCRMSLPDRRVTELGRYADTDVVAPNWSPDGSRVAFQTHARSSASEIVVVSFVDGTVTRLTSNSDDDCDPAWSPDGKWIAFASSRGKGGIYIMDDQGDNCRCLIADMAFSPVWSPDAKRIYFIMIPYRFQTRRSIPGNNSSFHFNLFATDVEEEKPVLLSGSIFGDGIRLLTNFNVDLGHPAVSPDGASLAYYYKGRYVSGIGIVGQDGKKQREFSFIHCDQLHWSADGRYLVLSETARKRVSILDLHSRPRPMHLMERIQLTSEDDCAFGAQWIK